MLIDPAMRMISGDRKETRAEQIQLANDAVNNGVTHALVTPDFPPEMAGLPDYMKGQVADLQEEFDRRGIQLIIFAGQILKTNENSVAAIQINNVLYADLNHHYMLVEAPEETLTTAFKDTIFELLKQDIRPVITQPERSRAFTDDESQVPYYYDQGCYFMVGSESVLGWHGKRCQKRIREWFRQGYIQLIGSFVTPGDTYAFRQAFQTVESWFGENYGFDIRQNGKALINGDPLLKPQVPKKTSPLRKLFRR